MSLDLFKKSLSESTVLIKNGYEYFVNPITDGIPVVEPNLLDEVVDEIRKKVDGFDSFDKIVTLEAMGIPLVTLLSFKIKKPFLIIRKRPYFFKDEKKVEQKTGYSNSSLYINGLKNNDRVIIVDDVLSTGGSLDAVLSALKNIGVKVVGAVVVVDKGLKADLISKKFDVDLVSLVKIQIKKGVVEILE